MVEDGLNDQPAMQIIGAVQEEVIWVPSSKMYTKNNEISTT